MKLIVGLGNPGKEYENTKHNVGFKCLDIVCEKLNITIDKTKFKSKYYQGIINNEKVIIIKPQTFMNLSGEAVIEFINYFDIDLENIIIIYDDMDTPIGKFRIRAKGSSGGQNGIKNIIAHTKDPNLARIRIGIGRPNPGENVNYVLSKFSKTEQELVDEVLNQAANAVIDFITTDVERLMSKYNKK